MSEAARKFEILKMARQVVHDEYINKRAEEHNRWVAQNAHAIRTTRQGIPYPPFTRHPTEADIVARARTLYDFVADPAPVVREEPIAAAEPVILEPEVVEVEEQLPDIEESVPLIEPEVKAEEHVLPGWIKGWIRSDRQ